MIPHHEVEDVPHFYVRARFGDAAGAGIIQGNAYLFVLRDVCKVASRGGSFAFVLP